MLGRAGIIVTVAKERRKSGRLKQRQACPRLPGGASARAAQESFDNVPIKPQRVYEEMSKAFGRDTCYVSVIGSRRSPGAIPRRLSSSQWIMPQAGPLGWTLPAALGVPRCRSDREIVALSGDYDFQFLIEETCGACAIQAALYPCCP